MLGSLAEVLPCAAERFGDKRALVVGERSFSFTELDELSSALAASLVRLGVAPGDRVTLYAPNSWEWIVSYYGVLKTGAVINPVNVMLTPAEVAYVTRDCGAKALIGSPEKVEPALRAGVSGLDAIVFGDEPIEGATPFADAHRRRRGLRAGTGRSGGALDHRLHVRYDGPSQGRDAVPPCGHAQWRHDGADAPEVGARHGRVGAAVPARLRQCRLQRRPDVRTDARAASSLRRGRGAFEHRDASRDHVRGRADDVHVHARASRASSPSTSRPSRAARSAARPCPR